MGTVFGTTTVISYFGMAAVGGWIGMRAPCPLLSVGKAETDWFWLVQFMSHSFSFDQRRRVCWPRTAMDSAFFCPTSTTSRLPRVTAV